MDDVGVNDKTMRKIVKKIIVSIFVVACLLTGLMFLIGLPTQSDKWTNRTDAESDLNTICRFSWIFAEKHNGVYPLDWAELISEYPVQLSKDVFVIHPNKGIKCDPKTVMEWTDYVYVRGATTASPPGTILAYLPPGHIKSRTPAIIQLLDGRREALSVHDFTKMLNRIPNRGAGDCPSRSAPAPTPSFFAPMATQGKPGMRACGA